MAIDEATVAVGRCYITGGKRKRQVVSATGTNVRYKEWDGKKWGSIHSTSLDGFASQATGETDAPKEG